MRRPRIFRSATVAALAVFVAVGGTPPAAAGSDAELTAPAPYAVDFAATAASGVAMNADGDVAGTSYPDPGCGSTCLPPLETVVWRDGKRLVLPTVPGLSGIYVSGINAHGWVTGLAGMPGTTTHAVVWKPTGGTYTAIDLGTLPGTTVSEAVGIDDLNRVIGWSTTLSFPPTGSPFLWTEASGMVDMSLQGYPDERPIAISPGATVLTGESWYRLGDPNSVVAVPAPPDGFYPAGSGPAAINDAGDQARFLVSTSTQNLRYLFRLHHDGTWQQLWSAGTGHMSVYGVGSISADGDVTATAVSTGLIAYGPDELAQRVAPLVAPAYQGGDVTRAGPINESGAFLAELMIGRSTRLVRLVPAEACTADCVRVMDLQMSASGPEYCDQGRTRAKANMTVTREAGTAVRRARVTGHFFDDYWLDRTVRGRTDSNGKVTLKHKGPACVGAIAFLVTDVVKSGRRFDQTTGILTSYVIPQS